MDVSGDDYDPYQSSNENIYQCDCFCGGGDSARDKNNRAPRDSTDDDPKISSLEKLRTLRDKVNWENVEERRQLLKELRSLVASWRGPLPNLLEVFRAEEIDWLLSRDATKMDYGRGKKFIEFAVRCGYKDRLDLDEAGKPRTARRTTPIHLAAEHNQHDLGVDSVLRLLFVIYDRFDVNYLAEELGTTHFHLACRHDLVDVVKKYLELGQDPNCLEPRTSKSPIYLAIKRNAEDVLAALLRHGADPNLAPRSDGKTPLHWICTRFELYDCDDYRLMEIFFRVCDELKLKVLVDARDSEGRTPLQWAVAKIQPRMVELILSHGADLSSFRFPDRSYFGHELRPPVDWEEETNYQLQHDEKVASGAMDCVEQLVEAGYELGLNDILTIMGFFVERGYTEISIDDDQDDDEDDEDDEDEDDDDDLAAHLCEEMSRFFRRWSLDPFYAELMNFKLPKECCEMIIRHLTNRDLYNVCLAAAGRES